MSHYLNLEEITDLHLEVSNLCNAACPMCARNNQGYGLTKNPGWGSWLTGDELRVFTDELPNLRVIDFCGTHGDPLLSPTLHDIVKKCKEKKGTSIHITTNGSLRSMSWWKKLISLLDNEDMITFSIDGLTTNHLYRQNTNIDMIMERLKLCANSHIQVGWDFLAFEHNEHELDAAMELAKSMGIRRFRIRKTTRFAYVDSHPVRNKNNEITHYLNPPKNENLRHPDFKTMQLIYKKIPDNFSINCMYKAQKKMYVNSRLEVFPCCYIADEHERLLLNKDPSKVQVPLLSLREHTWTEILSHPFYNKDFVDSFNTEKTIDRCKLVCGFVERDKNQNTTLILNSNTRKTD